MANDFTGPTHYIDTVMTVPPAIFKNCDIYIESMNWSNMASGATLTVTDRNAKVIYDTTANAANVNINIPKLGWQKGYIVTVLSSGNVQIAVGGSGH